MRALDKLSAASGSGPSAADPSNATVITTANTRSESHGVGTIATCARGWGMIDVRS
jgi:hypothetical protein